jgi:hypothetical protein
MPFAPPKALTYHFYLKVKIPTHYLRNISSEDNKQGFFID